MATDLELLLDLKRQQWFICNGGTTYVVKSESDIAASAGYLPITILEDQDDPLSPVGQAQVLCVESALHFSFVIAGESTGERIVVDTDNVRLHSCIWTKGSPARDRWIMADAVLSVENVRCLKLSCFLPKAEDGNSKTLQISSAGGYSQRRKLVRGKTTTFELTPPFPGQHRLHFCTTPEQSNQDRRILGFLLAGLDVQADEHVEAAAT